MRLAVSHTYFNKKLDEFGQGHEDDVLQIMEMEKKKLQKAFPIPDTQVIAEKADVDHGNSSLSEASRAIHAQRLALIEDIPHSDLEIDFAVPAMKQCFRKFLSKYKFTALVAKKCRDCHVKKDMKIQDQYYSLFCW